MAGAVGIGVGVAVILFSAVSARANRGLWSGFFGRTERSGDLARYRRRSILGGAVLVVLGAVALVAG